MLRAWRIVANFEIASRKSAYLLSNQLIIITALIRGLNVF